MIGQQENWEWVNKGSEKEEGLEEEKGRRKRKRKWKRNKRTRRKRKRRSRVMCVDEHRSEFQLKGRKLMMCDSLTPSLIVSIGFYITLFLCNNFFFFFPTLNPNSTAFSLTHTSAAGRLLFGNVK